MLLKIYYSSWEDGIYSFSIQSRYIDDINFSVFSEDARIQIHGCNTARDSLPCDTLTEALSKGLYNAGKKKAYVIGHVSKSNPLINGPSTTNIAQDYRHGKRAIIYNGKVIKVTTDKEIIGHSIIPISSKIKIDEVINAALKSPMKKICLKGRKYVLDLPFNFIEPGGIRFYIDEFSSIEECKHIVD